MRIEIARGTNSQQDISHIGLTQAEIAGLLQAYQRIGYFRLDFEAGLIFFSSDACAIVGVDAADGRVNLTDVVRKLHAEDVELLTSTFETAARLKTGFDLICRIRQEEKAEKFIRMVGTFRPTTGEGEVVGIVHEFLERMRIIDFGDA